MTIRLHRNNITKTLDGDIDNVVTTLTLNNSTGLPSLSAGEEFRLTLVSGSLYEIVTVTDTSSAPTYDVIRGVEGSTAQAWADGVTVQLRGTADSYDRKLDIDSLNYVPGTTLTTTDTGTIVLDVDSTVQQIFTGTDFEVVQTPDVNTLAPGRVYRLVNNATNAVFVISSGSYAIVTMQPFTQVSLTFNGIIQPDATAWDVQYTSNVLGVQSVTGTDNRITASSPDGNLTLDIPVKNSFHAYNNTTQTIPSATFTKCILNAKHFDIGEMFDEVTDNRFLPTVPGVYTFTGSVNYLSGVAAIYYASIYKNGTPVAHSTNTLTGTSDVYLQTTVMLEMNGTTDYVELYTQQGDGSSQDTASDFTYLCGTLVDPA